MYILLESSREWWRESTGIKKTARRGTQRGPQPPTPRGANSHHRHRIVVKDRGHVFGGELVGGVADEQARLAHSTIAHDHTPGRNECKLLYNLEEQPRPLQIMHLSVTICARPQRGRRGGGKGSTDLIVATTILKRRMESTLEAAQRQSYNRRLTRGESEGV